MTTLLWLPSYPRDNYFKKDVKERQVNATETTQDSNNRHQEGHPMSTYMIFSVWVTLKVTRDYLRFLWWKNGRLQYTTTRPQDDCASLWRRLHTFVEDNETILNNIPA